MTDLFTFSGLIWTYLGKNRWTEILSTHLARKLHYEKLNAELIVKGIIFLTADNILFYIDICQNIPLFFCFSCRTAQCVCQAFLSSIFFHSAFMRLKFYLKVLCDTNGAYATTESETCVKLNFAVSIPIHVMRSYLLPF